MTGSVVDGRPGSDRLAELARDHPELVSLARTGWVAKGLVYGLVGVLAVPIALRGFDRGSGTGADEEASQNGAVAEIADHRFGEAVLWLVAAGLLLYAIWRVISILLPASNSARAWVTRAGYVVSVVMYLALAWSALSIARHRPTSGESEDSRVDRFTRDVMEMTGGRWIVGLIGVVVIAIGVAFVHRGATAGFRDELEPGGLGPIRHEALVRLGQVGWIGRGVMMALVGWFLFQAAIDFSPEEATGIDGSLRDATSSDIGAVLALVVAGGLIVYGAFCVLSAPRQRLTNAD